MDVSRLALIVKIILPVLIVVLIVIYIRGILSAKPETPPDETAPETQQNIITKGFNITNVVDTGEEGAEERRSILGIPTALGRLTQPQGTQEIFVSPVKEGGISVDHTNLLALDGEGSVQHLHTIHGQVNRYRAIGFIDHVAEKYDVSPYTGTVLFLDRPRSLKSSKPSSEYFVLQFSESLTRPVNISGWTVSGREDRILYEIPEGIRTLGSDVGIQNYEPILAEPGGTVIVSSGRSPTGFSFLLNKCSGYRSQFKQFTPTLKTRCPEPVDEFFAYDQVPYTDDLCYVFVESHLPCEAVVDFPTGVTTQCRRFLENELTEKGCIARHRNDPDFYTKNWRVFLGEDRFDLWDDEGDAILLFDDKGRLVTTYIY